MEWWSGGAPERLGIVIVIVIVILFVIVIPFSPKDRLLSWSERSRRQLPPHEAEARRGVYPLEASQARTPSRAALSEASVMKRYSRE